MMFWNLLAQMLAPAEPSGWASMGATGVCLTLLVWLITKGYPSLMERHDKSLRDVHDRFEKTQERVMVALQKQTDVVRELTDAVRDLTAIVRAIERDVVLTAAARAEE